MNYNTLKFDQIADFFLVHTNRGEVHVEEVTQQKPSYETVYSSRITRHEWYRLTRIGTRQIPLQ